MRDTSHYRDPSDTTDYDRERRLDRDYEREGGYASRRRIPLHEGGAVRTHFTKPVTVQPSPSWRPSDEVAK